MTAVNIEPPLPADTRSSVADWLELSALYSSRGTCTAASLLSVLDFTEDKALKRRLSQGEDDESILEEARETFVAAVFDELEYRASLLSADYPYDLDARRRSLVFKGVPEKGEAGQISYLFCLLVTALRTDVLKPTPVFEALEKKIAVNFQAVSCLAAGGYIGSVSSFGFPRANGSAFLPALRAAFVRFGAGHVRANDDVPAGFPTELKDGGIDIIAWRDFSDGMPGKIFLLGQCASGKGWRTKSILEYVAQLDAWFTAAPAKHSLPAMFIPFPFHHEIEADEKVAYLQVVKNRFWFEEKRYGLIFDRLRVSHCAGLCGRNGASSSHVDGVDQLEDIRGWVRQACSPGIDGEQVIAA